MKKTLLRRLWLRCQWIVSLSWALLAACGGGGGSSVTTDDQQPSPSHDDGTSDTSNLANLVGWVTKDRGLYRQRVTEASGTYLTYRGAVGGDINELVAPSLGDDRYIEWSRSPDSSGHWVHFHIFSVADVLRQQQLSCISCTYPKPLRTVSVDGAWESQRVFLSSDGRYIAGPWSSNNSKIGSEALLAIVDLQAPQGQEQIVYNPPGPVGEKVDMLQWVGAAQFIVRNQSGRKFLWTVGSNAWQELKAPPAGGFNGYQIVSEVYSPDGMKYAGLMSKDGGQTHEVWVANPDYSDMQQITWGGLKLQWPQWLGDSSALLFHFDTIGGYNNRCASSVVNPATDRMLTATQFVKMELPPNMECNFQAARVK